MSDDTKDPNAAHTEQLPAQPADPAAEEPPARPVVATLNLTRGVIVASAVAGVLVYGSLAFGAGWHSHAFASRVLGFGRPATAWQAGPGAPGFDSSGIGRPGMRGPFGGPGMRGGADGYQRDFRGPGGIEDFRSPGGTQDFRSPGGRGMGRPLQSAPQTDATPPGQ